MAIFGDFFVSCISASRLQQVSGLHLKFALRPHHVWKYGRHPLLDIHSATAEIMRRKKDRRKKKEEQTTAR